jgi:hypothetical protein
MYAKDAKGITALNLVRMGILKGSGLKLFSAAQFKTNYDILTDSEINQLHSRITTYLRTLPHGPFRAVRSILGDRQAMIFGSDRYRQCVLPDSYLNGNTSSSNSVQDSEGSPSKRRRVQEIIEID